MLKDILEILFSLPNENEIKNMTPSERADLIKKFDNDDSSEEE